MTWACIFAFLAGVSLGIAFGLEWEWRRAQECRRLAALEKSLW